MDVTMKSANDFNWKQYILNNADVKQAGISTYGKAYNHWITVGKKEGRTYNKITLYNDFNWKQYILNNADLKQAGITTYKKAYNHWLKNGEKEGRTYKKIDIHNTYNSKHCDISEHCDISDYLKEKSSSEYYVKLSTNIKTMFNINIYGNNICDSYITYTYKKLSNLESDKLLPKFQSFTSLKNFIVIIDFPKIGGGTSVFLNAILQQYKNFSTFLIIRNYENNYIITINDDYILDEFTEKNITAFLSENSTKITKIFINHALGHTTFFLEHLKTLNKEINYITHDYYSIFKEPQYTFNEFTKNNEYDRHLMSICDRVVTQNIENLNIYSSFLKENTIIDIVELPDFRKSKNKYEYNNKKIVIGIIGAIAEIKGKKVIAELNKYYLTNSNIEFVVLGKIHLNNIKYIEYQTINEFNKLLIQYKPNVLLELSIWPETYSYTLTLAMLTQLPIISLRKSMRCTVVNRLSTYDKVYTFENITEFDTLIHTKKQNYLYTIDENIYYNKYWNEYFVTQHVIKKNIKTNKVADLEIQKINSIINKNIVVITSKIVVSSNRLSYVDSRSIYTKEERFTQTLETIESIKKHIPDYYIILFDNSILDNSENETLNNSVDKFINITNDGELNHNTNICDLKIIGELTQNISLYENYLKYIDFSKNINYFKISGRYHLNDEFEYERYNNNSNIFKKNKFIKDREYFYTSFFKLNNKDVNYFYESFPSILNKDYSEIKNYDYEVLIPNILCDKIVEVDRLGIRQYISVWNEISDI